MSKCAPNAVTPGPVGVVSRPRHNTTTTAAVSLGPIRIGSHIRYLQSTIFLDDYSPIICAQVVRLGLHQMVMSDDVSGGTGLRICTHTHTHLHTVSAPPLLSIENLLHRHHGEISGQNRKRGLAPI